MLKLFKTYLCFWNFMEIRRFVCGPVICRKNCWTFFLIVFIFLLCDLFYRFIMSYLLLKLRKDSDSTISTATTIASKQLEDSGGGDESGPNNEFSNGYAIRFWELVIVVFVIVLWLGSLYRFIKHFDKLRITHHREIPYKLRQKEAAVLAANSNTSSCNNNSSSATACTSIHGKTLSSTYLS